MKQKFIALAIALVTIVGGWLIGQETTTNKGDRTEEEQNDYRDRLRAAMEKRAAEAQKISSGVDNTPSVSNTSPPPASAQSSGSGTTSSNTTPTRQLPKRVIKVGGGETMDLEKLMKEAQEKQRKVLEERLRQLQNQAGGTNTPPSTILSPDNGNQNPPPPNAFGQLDVPGASGNNIDAGAGKELYSMNPPPDAPDTPFDLVNVLDYYAEVSGRMPIRRVSVNNDPQIYVNFTDLTREEALEYLQYSLSLNGIAVLPVGSKFFQVTESTDAPRVGQDFIDSDEYEFKRLGSFVQTEVQLKYIPTEIAKTILDPMASTGNEQNAVIEIPTNNMLILRDNEPNVKMMLEMLKDVDVNVPLEVELELIPIRYALADEIASVLGTLTPSGAVQGSSRNSSNSRFGSGRSSRSSSRTDTTNNRAQTNTTNPTQNRSAFQNRLQNIVSRAATGDFMILGDTKIIPDERTNSILVFANKRDMSMIKQIIGKLDVVQAQVLIEAVIMEVSIGDNEDLGLSVVNRNPNGVGGSINDPGLSDTLLRPGEFSADSSLIPGLPSGFSYFSAIGSDINVAVRALATNRKASVLQRPRIQTFHAREASIIVGESRPFVGGTFFGSGFGGAGGSSSSQINYQDISVELHVLPLINQEGLVVLEIEQIVKDLNGFETIDGNRIPVVANRSASASVAVQDGQTIILGGMITTNKSVSKSGIPVLKDIPLMGGLFSNKSESENQVELVVLIKPKVMPTPEIAKDVAATELEKLVVTQQAKHEIEKARAKIADKIKAERAKEQQKNPGAYSTDY